MQQLKHIIFQDLLNEPRTYSSFWEKCINSHKTGKGCSTPLKRLEKKNHKQTEKQKT